ncbi:transcriptional regulator [Streptomyces sp. WM4235]|uniref:type 1 glutamine amidotransferase domain-containing protein n=1 Tax=Streptomyces sp. WM4235 TaxID=1415551 RepID=UPI0006AD91E8|nr:type 1 glutamine amidotransferase domain-containing protein [Streptomyces sp. WM4235]KOU64305.1 transcriptional regulator [Streptomyces sp. WM4235]
MTNLLIVVSAADRWTLKDGAAHPTGYWAEELAVPHRLFTKAGWKVDIATPAGVAPTVDPVSLTFPAGGTPGRNRRRAAYLDSIAPQLQHPGILAHSDPDDYDAVFYPGGHGPMEDLAVDPDSGALLTRTLTSGKPLALLCHAGAALLAAENADGSWPFAGYWLTALSNTEERLGGLKRKAPWLLQDRLIERGANYTKAALPLRPHVEIDRNLYTGQNPASSAKLAHALIAAVTRRAATAHRP